MSTATPKKKKKSFASRLFGGNKSKQKAQNGDVQTPVSKTTGGGAYTNAAGSFADDGSEAYFSPQSAENDHANYNNDNDDDDDDGNAMDMDEICSIAEAHGLWVFEDACESLGVSWKERNVGTFGDAGSYSFYFSHHISTIEGGMVVTDNDDLAELMRSMRAHGWTRHLRSKESVEAKYPDLNPQFLFVSSGFNLRSTEINAAIGLVQLKKLDRFNDKRRSVTRALLAGIRDLIADGCLRTPSYSSNAKVAPFGFPALCQSKETRDALVSCLNFNEIETRPIICGNMVRQPAIKHYDYRVSGSLPGADEIMDCGLYWGTHPLMTESQIAHLTKTVREFFKS